MQDYDPFNISVNPEEKDAQKYDDIKEIMSMKSGRRFVCGMLEQMGVWRSSFSADPLTMAYSEGRRSLGLSLTARLMQECHEEYFLMLKEFNKHD